MSVQKSVICPSGCASELPELDMDVCSPEIDFGEITKIYFTNVGNPLVDVTSLPEWLSRLSNTSTNDDAIRYLHVSAEMPEATREEIIGSLCRTFNSPGDFIINAEIDETVNDVNYEFVRKTWCNPTFLIWFQAGKFIYGGNEGIEAQPKFNNVIGKGCKTINKFIGTFKWTADNLPARALNPII